MRKKRKVLITLAMILALILGAGLVIKFVFKKDIRITTGFTSSKLVSIGSQTITVAEGKIFMTNQRNLYEELYGAQIWQIEVDGVYFSEHLKDKLKTDLGNIAYVLEMAGQKSISLTMQEESRLEKAAQDYYDTLTEEDISYMGINLDTVSQLYKKYYLANKTIESLADNLDLEISDDEARIITIQQIFLPKYTEDDEGNKTYRSEEEQQSLCSSAESVRQMAADGDDFTNLAGQYSYSSGTQMIAGREDFNNSALEQAAFSLGSGEISGVVETEEGFYIIKCINHYHVDLTLQHKTEMKYIKIQEAFEEEFEQFVQSVQVNYQDSAWDKIDYADTEFNAKSDQFFSIYNSYFGMENS